MTNLTNPIFTDQDKDLDPYFLAIGKLSSAWNRLQDAMAFLFTALHAPLPSAIPLGVWYTVKSDRGQREMLKAAAAGRFRDDELGLVEIQDSQFGLYVIQAFDGSICFDGRPMGEDGTALPG